MDCLLDNKFEQIPLVITDSSEEKEYLYQLSKGELFVWNLVDANRNSCSRNSNDSAFEELQSMENDTLIAGTPRKVVRDITYYEIESDKEDEITYVLKYNLNKDYSKIPLNRNKKKRASFQSYFFCDVSRKKICQFYEAGTEGKGTICNDTIVRSEKDTKGRSLARLMKRHLKIEHDFCVEKSTLDVSILQYFYPLREDYKILCKFLQKVSPMKVSPTNSLAQRAVVNNSGFLSTFQRRTKNTFSDWEAFCMHVRIMVRNYGSYASIEDDNLRVFHNYVGSQADTKTWRRRKAPIAISQSADIVIEKIKLFFTETKPMVDKFSVAASGLNREEISHAITVQYKKNLVTLFLGYHSKLMVGNLTKGMIVFALL